jgi:TetR/AcrR family transcriptional regulator
MNSLAIEAAPKRRRRRNSAEQLLDAVSKILTERNTTDVSLSDVAEESKLNSALIKYHYKNKEGLLLALVRRNAQTAMAQLEHLVEMTIPIEQKIRFHVFGIVNTYAKYPYLNRLIHELLESDDDEVVRDLVNFFVTPLVAAEEKLLREGVEAGVFRPVEPMHFYFSVVGACDQLFFSRQSLKYAFGVNEISPEMREAYADFVATMAIKTLRKE